MELTQEQRSAVSEWVSEGIGLSDIQKKLSEEFGITMKFMDVRFLVIELGLDVKDKPSVPDPKAPAADSSEPELAETVEPDAVLTGGVSVSVDRVMKPGSLVSGTVRFSDGVSSDWALDQFGRIALQSDQPGYKPSQEDLQAFQEELREALAQRGF